jgi:hypothetical protein
MGDGGKELRLNLVYINGRQLILLKHMGSGSHSETENYFPRQVLP